ncbi:hypothetical protein JCM5353_000677 [Sporobolomyces roseus]
MPSFTTALWNFVTLKSTSKRATPTLISNVFDTLRSTSIHDRSTYLAPSLRSPQLAFESKLFLDHPTRYVSFGELIPGLAPPSEIQVQELESIEAEGTIVSITLAENELERRLLQSLALTSAPTPLLSDPTLPSHFTPQTKKVPSIPERTRNRCPPIISDLEKSKRIASSKEEEIYWAEEAYFLRLYVTAVPSLEEYYLAKKTRQGLYA